MIEFKPRTQHDTPAFLEAVAQIDAMKRVDAILAKIVMGGFVLLIASAMVFL